MTTIADDEPIAVAVTEAIHAGDLATLTRLLGENPSLATARIAQSDCDDDQGTDTGRTLLHVATDWPGNFPNGAGTVRTLVGAGADVNARCRGPESAETPLHWAASSNDIDVLDALVEAGADIEAPGAVIGGGPPLADATAFGQWKAAQRLVEHGAHTTLWHAAALGLTDQIEAHLADEPAPVGKDDRDLCAGRERVEPDLQPVARGTGAPQENERASDRVDRDVEVPVVVVVRSGEAAAIDPRALAEADARADVLDPLAAAEHLHRLGVHREVRDGDCAVGED